MVQVGAGHEAVLGDLQAGHEPAGDRLAFGGALPLPQDHFQLEEGSEPFHVVDVDSRLPGEKEVSPLAHHAEHAEARLEHLLERHQPRYFRAGQGKARGHTGAADLEAFVDSLELLQDCAVRIGKQLEMDTVSRCVVYEKDATTGYGYEPDSNPRYPVVVGAMVSRRVPIRELLAGMSEQ